MDRIEIDHENSRWLAARKLVGHLTAREHEIFLMLGDGLDNGSISSMLAISQRTVKFHITSILRKLEVESRLQAGLAAAEYSRSADFPKVQ
jgi:DNA-binding NarL/FixJ family response regulator